jgi:uncharacterized membrane protein
MAKDFFTDDQQKQIVAAVKQAEKNTSGEIRIFLENRCKEDVLERAVQVFKVLGMNKTELRNGVLFYLAVKDHKFAVIGDKGINEKVPANFWDSIKDHMRSCFVEGRFADGLSDGVRMAGEQLGAHFPYQKEDVNELPDDLAFGDN